MAALNIAMKDAARVSCVSSSSRIWACPAHVVDECHTILRVDHRRWWRGERYQVAGVHLRRHVSGQPNRSRRKRVDVDAGSDGPWVGHIINTVSYTHLTLPTNREV